MEFLITLTDVEVKALSYVMSDPKEWTQNAISERARLAGLEIVASETERMVNDPEIHKIPADYDEIILNAPEPNFGSNEEIVTPE